MQTPVINSPKKPSVPTNVSASNLTRQGTDAVSDTIQDILDNAQQVRKVASDKIDEGMEALKSYRKDAVDVASKYYGTVESGIKARPMIATAAAVGVGVLVGGLLTRALTRVDRH